MKVIIGKYPRTFSCNVFSNYMNRKYGYVDWPLNYSRFEKFLDHCENFVQSILNNTVNRLIVNREQKIYVRIDPWDTWGMDHTLASIILPMLIQLKATKHGAPFVEMEDRPEQYRAERPEHFTDEHHFSAWDWVLDEMIYAFTSKASGEEPLTRFKYPEEKDQMIAEQERIANGFRLFGKYYEALWD